ncbi:PEGA domain-containing protein [Chloroflexota bacterium]
MRKLKLNKRNDIILHIMLALAVIGISPFAIAAATTNSVAAASATVPVNMCYYGWMDYGAEQAIINAHPEFFVGNSAAGPWRGNANISKLQAAGIKYFEYIDAAYVGYGTYARPIPTDLWSNLNYIEAAAQAGAYGIFVDEVCDGIYTTPDYYYLGQIANKAHSLGLKVVFNTGMPNWADALMDYCDYINSSETWQGGALSPSQSKWASRTWLLTYNVYDAATAATLTNSALSKGIRAHYATSTFSSLPYYFPTYVSQISSYTAVSVSTPVTPSSVGQTSVTFNSTPVGVEVWLDYSYKGLTPLTIDIAAGSHHIGFARYGYSTLEDDFIVDNTAFTVTGDLLSRQITSTGTETVSSTQTPVSFTSNLSGVEVWLDYSYKGLTPLTIDVAAGSHHIGFYKYGYNYNLSNDTDFSLSGQQTLNIYGDMLAGYTSVS